MLLVEDDLGDVRLLRSLLAGTGQQFDLHIAGTLDEAVEALGRVSVDVALVDLGLPDVTGLQVVQRLREVSGQLPVVVLTGRDDPQLGVTALQYGAQDYLVKGQATGAEIERSLRFAIERERLTHLVTAAVLQREAVSSIEAAGRRIVTLEGFVEELVAAIAEVLPQVAVALDVDAAGRSVHREPDACVGPGWDSEVWPLDGVASHGELVALTSADRALTENERAFLGRAAEATIVALDAFDAATGKRLRERQLQVLYEVSRALVACVEESEVPVAVAPLVADALGTRDDVRVTVTLDDASMTAGEVVGPPVLVEEPVTVDGSQAGTVAVEHAHARAWSPEDAMVLGHVARLVESWASRRGAERDRDEGQRRMQQLLEQLPVAVWSTDRDLRFTSMTGAGAAPLDPSPEPGTSLVDYFGSGAQVAVDNHRRALAGETVAHSFEWQQVWWEVVVGPLVDDVGTVVGVFGVGLDATVTQRARQVASDASRRYTALFDQSRDAFVLTDEQGRFTDVNEAMCRLVGRTREELLGLRAVDLAPVAPDSRRFGTLRERLQHDGSQRGTLRLARADGTTVEVEYDATAEILPGVNLAILRDVTEQIVMQRALQESEQRFRALAQHAVDGIFRITLTPERTYEYVNPAFERITGFTAQDVMTDPLLLQRRTDPDDVVDDTDDHPKTIRFQRADDQWRWLELRQTPIHDDDGHLVAVQGIVLDVTDPKRHADAIEAALSREQQATDELRRLNTLRNTFLQAASHELRTPLTVVYGLAETLRNHQHELDEQQVETLLARLTARAQNLRQLLDDLLDLDRLTRDTITPHLQVVDLADVVRSVTEDFPVDRHVLALDLAPTPATVEPAKVERIVHNLLANIVKHTPSGTTARITTHPDHDGTAVLLVEDDGPGIDPTIREQLFDPFVQGAASAHLAQPGTGIGLSLVHKLTRLHEGTCSLEDPPDGGTRFRVTFPFSPSTSPTRHP